MSFPLTYLGRGLLLQRLEVAEPGDVGGDAPIVELAGRFIQLLILWHGSDDAFFEPGWKGLNRLASYCGLSIDVEDVRDTSWSIPFGESRDCTVVQEFDPLDRSVNAVAVADSKAGEAFVLFIPRGYLFPCFFLESFESLMEVSNGLSILFHIPVVDPVPLLDGFDKGRGELTKSDRIADIKALYEVSRRGRGDRVDVRGVEVRERHEDRSGGARGSVWSHGDVGVRGTEWERVGRVGA